MTKNKILPSVTLGSICLIVALLLALINTVTGPKIQQNNNDKANASLNAVLPGHTGFTDVAIPENFPKSIDLIKKSAEGGYVFRSVVTGKMSTQDLIRDITQRSAFKEGVVTGVLIALEEALQASLAEGKSVHWMASVPSASVPSRLPFAIVTKSVQRALSSREWCIRPTRSC